MKAMLNEIYVRHTGKKLTEIEKSMDRDNFMGPEEALKFGLIDKVVEAHKTIEDKLDKDKKDKK
jgi:ATP-dependent Clp protease protease subunit